MIGCRKHVIFGFMNTMSLNSCDVHVFDKHRQPQTSTSTFIYESNVTTAEYISSTANIMAIV